MEILSEEIDCDSLFWFETITIGGKPIMKVRLRYGRDSQDVEEFFLLHACPIEQSTAMLVGEVGDTLEAKQVYMLTVGWIESFDWNRCDLQLEASQPQDLQEFVSLLKQIHNEYGRNVQGSESFNSGLAYTFYWSDESIRLCEIAQQLGSSPADLTVLDRDSTDAAEEEEAVSPPSTPPRRTVFGSYSGSVSSNSQLDFEPGIFGTPGLTWEPLSRVLQKLNSMRQENKKGLEKRSGGVATIAGVAVQIQATLLKLLQLIIGHHKHLRFLIPEFVCDFFTWIERLEASGEVEVTIGEVKSNYGSALMMKAGHQIGRASLWLLESRGALGDHQVDDKYIVMVVTPTAMTRRQLQIATERVKKAAKASNPQFESEKLTVENMTEEMVFKEIGKAVEVMGRQISAFAGGLDEIKAMIDHESTKDTIHHWISSKLGTFILETVGSVGRTGTSVANRAMTPVMIMKKIQELEALLKENSYMRYSSTKKDEWWRAQYTEEAHRRNTMIQSLQNLIQDLEGRVSHESSRADSESSRADSEASRADSAEARAERVESQLMVEHASHSQSTSLSSSQHNALAESSAGPGETPSSSSTSSQAAPPPSSVVPPPTPAAKKTASPAKPAAPSYMKLTVSAQRRQEEAKK